MHLEALVETAREAARAGAGAALAHWRRSPAITIKADRSPVTEADRDAEAAIEGVIRARFPDHAILGEEGGERGGPSRFRWVVDPLDGTKGFIRGGEFWGPLVACEEDGEVVAGAMVLPVRGTAWWAGRGLGCFRDGARVRLAPDIAWSECTVSAGELGALLTGPQGSALATLFREAASVRSFGDVGGVAMLLDGRAEVWFEAGVKLWDLAAVKILVEEAGGVFTDLEGKAAASSGSAVAGIPSLHALALARLRAGLQR